MLPAYLGLQIQNANSQQQNRSSMELDYLPAINLVKLSAFIALAILAFALIVQIIKKIWRKFGG